MSLKFKLSLIIFLCISFSKVNAQVDSIQFYKEKVKVYTSTTNNSINQSSYIDLLNDLSYQMRYFGIDTMKTISKSALDLSKKINYKEGELEALSNLSAFYLYKGDYKKAIENGLKVISDKQLRNFPVIEIKTHNHLGQVSFIQQEYPLTYTYFLHGLTVSEKNNNEYYKFIMQMNLGTLFSLLEDYDEAILYYTNTLKLNDTIIDNNREAMLSSNLGYLYIQKEEYTKAENYLNKSITYFKSTNNKQWLSFSLTTLGQLNLKLKNYNNSISNFENALEIIESKNELKVKADIYYGLAVANFKNKNVQKAEEQINESLRLYKYFNINTGLERANRIIYEIKKEQSQNLEALNYLELTEELANKNSIKKNRTNLNMLKAKIKFEKEKETLKTNNDIALEEQRKYLKWSLAAFITSLLIVLIVLNANKREKLLIKKLENNAVVLNKSQKALIAINNNQDKLFSIVGHDLRGPIISFNELLKLYIEDPKGKEYFEKFAPQIKSDLDYLQLTTDNLLYWGKTQMKGNLSKAEHILVKKEIDLILQLYRSELNKKTIEVDCQIKKTDFVTIDINQFNVIFRNILSNAIKFTPNGGKITLSTTLKDATLVIKISDTGVGMSPETVNKLFNNEAHISTKGTNFEKGTGLGLRLVKELIINNNGSIVVQSQLNIGSNFIIELPHVVT
tara:strand:- start:33530 stop:35566 length:2037 start_codon:yes stop_codon:yes gene_type:complete